MQTPLAREMGLEFPIFAFSHCRDVVAAVSRAGGMGVLGALYFTPEELVLRLGIDRLIRLGIGIEDADDLIACLNWAIHHA